MLLFLSACAPAVNTPVPTEDPPSIENPETPDPSPPSFPSVPLTLTFTLTPMFHRLLLDDSTTLVTLAAFIVAASIFITFVWRAIRMSRRQCERFENLPFETPTPPSVALRGSAGTSDSDDNQESRSSRSGLHQSSDR